MADLHQGDTGSATTNLCVLLALVRDNQDEGIMVSQLVRMAMAVIGTSATWEFLQSTNATDAQLATLQKSWEQMEFIRTTEAAFVFEQAWGANVIEKLRASHHEFAGLLGGPSGGPAWSWPPDLEAMANSAKRTCAEVMWRNSWSFTQEIHSLQANQIILETLRHMKTNSFFKPDCDAMKSRLSALGITNVGEAFFRALDIPDFEDFFMGSDNLGSVVFKAIRMEAARRVVITAIALKRFQLQHGKLPEKISELAPEFLAAIPIDPFDGKPLRYRPNADGIYLLYCVGEDGVDDGGDPSLPASVTSDSLYWQNNKARDWVWPQPATEIEIQMYYEEQAKKSR